jgi:hypothetical protein
MIKTGSLKNQIKQKNKTKTAIYWRFFIIQIRLLPVRIFVLNCLYSTIQAKTSQHQA